MFRFKTILIIIVLLFLNKVLISQKTCGTDILHENLLKDSNYKKLFDQTSEKFKQILNNIKQKKVNAIIENDNTKPFVIKLVVHVIHHGEPVGVGKNFSDSYIFSVIDEINNIYRNYYKNSVNMNIQFQLADIDPTGNPTNGINRVDGSKIVNYNYGIVDNLDIACNGQYGATYNDILLNCKWDQNKYYNIYCLETNNCIGWAGFAYYPTSNLNSNDYSFISNNYFTSDVIAHELGHSLNLIHTFYNDGTGNTCPSNAPNSGDQCDDTPPHKRGDCVSDICYLGTYNNDLYKSAYNYMSYCHVKGLDQYLFTPNQSERTNGALFLESRVVLTTKVKRFNIVTINETPNLGKIRESIEVDSGTSNYIYFSANYGFQIDSIFINNKLEINSNLNFVIINKIANNTTVRVKFSSKKFYINIKTLNSNLQNFKDSLTFIQNLKISYSPISSNYKFDFISVNGKKFTDSISSFTFNNIDEDKEVYVKYIPINNVGLSNVYNSIVKVNDTLKVKGSSINYLLLRKRNFNFYIKLFPISKIQLKELDTLYYFLVLKNIESDLYLVKGVGYNLDDTSSIYKLIKIYLYNNLKPIGWGSNSNLQIDSLEYLNNIVQVSAGSFYALYLDKFGKVYKTGGGLTPSSLLSPPNDLFNVVEVKAGLGYQAMAILTDGTVRMWGSSSENKLSNSLTDIIDVVGLWDATLALNINGEIIGIGNKNILQKYLYNTSYNNYKVAKIESGLYHFMTLTDNNLLFNFGDLQYYDKYNAFKPNSNSNISNIYGKRYSSSAALKIDSTALVWGVDDSSIFNNPILISNKFSQIGLGYKFFVGLLPNGNLIGIGDTLNQRLPIPVFLNNVKAISCGNDFTIALIENTNQIIYTNVVNGSITPSQLIMNDGSKLRITYNPNIGYKLDSIVVNGNNLGVDSLQGFTFVNNNKSQTIKVYFSIKKFNVVIKYGTNGIIIPSTYQIVNYGSNFELQIQANVNYIIDTLLINSKIIFFEEYVNRLTYLFKNIQGDSLIYVTFKENPCLNSSINTTIPNIFRSNNLLISDKVYNKYLWFINNNSLTNLVLSTNVNEFAPQTEGIYSLKGQDNNKCNSNFSKKYYYSSTCITISQGRLGNGAIIQNQIFNFPNLIFISWCPDIIKNDLRIIAYSMEGRMIFNQVYNSNSGRIILQKSSIQEKNFYFQIIDNSTNELIQISDIIRN